MKNLVDRLNHIAGSVYAQLKPSKVHGIGVFAVRDIPKGIAPLEGGSGKPERFYKLPIKDINKLPKYFVDVIKNYSVREKDYYWVSLGSWNDYAVQDFLNHSETPNMTFSGDDEFVSARNIRKGEELTANYREFDDSWPEKLGKAATGKKSKRG